MKLSWYTNTAEVFICWSFIQGLVTFMRPSSSNFIVKHSSLEVYSFTSDVEAPPLSEVYEFWLTVDLRLTMSVWKNDEAPPLIYNETEQKFYRRDTNLDVPCDILRPFLGDEADIPVGDGRHRSFIGANGSLPGPSLVVYQNSRLIVHILNQLPEEATSVHWHGLDQRGTFFMDGVPSVSQHPIAPGTWFTYNFTVSDEPGTYWYHGHTGSQMADGFFGALIILPRPSDSEEVEISKTIEQSDHVVLVNDWFYQPGNYYYYATRFDIMKMAHDFGGSKNECYYITRDAGGGRLGAAPFHSILINGRGWSNVDQLITDYSRLPISHFQISNNGSVRLRFIHSGTVFALMIRLQGHRFKVIALDGYPIQSVTVDYIIIQPAERIDVILQPRESTNTAGNTFVLKVSTTEYYSYQFEVEKELQKHFAYALLNYTGDRSQTELKVALPLEIEPICTEESCLVLNCPFPFYPPGFNRTCINLENLSSSPTKLVDFSILNSSESAIDEYRLNVRYEGKVHTINGIYMVMPHFPPFLFEPNVNQVMTPCMSECGYQFECSCTHVVQLTIGRTIQLVIYSNGPKGVDAAGSFGHPFHLHGHHFFVVGVGYPKYNPLTGIYRQCQTDLTCEHFQCNFANWNSSETQHTIYQSLHLNNPVLKDTVFVPMCGYVIIRFKADNPGWWFAHCHMLVHQMDGMTVIFREGTSEEMPTLPDNTSPVCGTISNDLKTNTVSESLHFKQDQWNDRTFGSLTTRQFLFVISISLFTFGAACGLLGGLAIAAYCSGRIGKAK